MHMTTFGAEYNETMTNVEPILNLVVLMSLYIILKLSCIVMANAVSKLGLIIGYV